MITVNDWNCLWQELFNKTSLLQVKYKNKFTNTCRIEMKPGHWLYDGEEEDKYSIRFLVYAYDDFCFYETHTLYTNDINKLREYANDKLTILEVILGIDDDD